MDRQQVYEWLKSQFGFDAQEFVASVTYQSWEDYDQIPNPVPTVRELVYLARQLARAEATWPQRVTNRQVYEL